MRNRELTEAQKRYKAFDRRRLRIVTVMIVWVIIITIVFSVGIWRAEEDGTLLLVSLGIIIASLLVFFPICRKIARRHQELYSAAYENDRDVVHTGLFGELWQSFDAYPYGEIAGGKVEYTETWSNSIELGIRRNRHEFSVVIDPEGLYMVVDEEKDTCREMEISLSEIPDEEQFFAILEEFIRENS